MKGRILVIDDDDGVRSAVDYVLAAAGYQIASVANGQEAIDLFDAFDPDLVIIDVVMPVLDGIETIARLRERRQDLKIIAMSGGVRIGNDNILDRAMRLGADHLIAKPFEAEQLASLVRQTIG